MAYIPYLSEIMICSFNYPPKGWALCNGQLLPINQNQGLFSLLGTTYGGNGQTNFALPNLQGRVPLHRGAGFNEGQQGGEVAHTLAVTEMPTHTHFVNANIAQAPDSDGNLPGSARRLAKSNGGDLYGAPSSLTALDPTGVSFVGGSQPHPNLQPYLVLSFCIALQGVFPSQN